ncbi:external alternative NAD(P)H-ubiquinone oxidoreductase B3, mitochondrial-like [Malania oleifera]|uniref:external alternative NAD(P)H-ubiquinone oxidoreductase B3, mitochondrial-like n=1 Tax=Malania oleifera TaxID=397392 RepID=UPI0025AE8ECC|nr:external alternative NAD(P)H-ubiquinone oxidoreductase B3, mitochondrial-like [Malania oleifera]
MLHILQVGKPKFNDNCLLNFHYDLISRPRTTLQKIKPYNKDLCLQANYKFVVFDPGDYTLISMDPDNMLQWEDIMCVKYLFMGLEDHRDNVHFLKEVEDAQRIYRTMINFFERANLPNVTEENRKRILCFIIFGGGPISMEFAIGLHGFVNKDLAELYPTLKDLVKITLLEVGDHILNIFDKRIIAFVEEKFQRDHIHLKTRSLVVEVIDKEISTKERGTGETLSVPYAMVVWLTSIGTRPIIMDFLKQHGQTDRRALATDEWLRVEGCVNTYALGDYAMINQRKFM